ncbi:hypothetical protein VC83_02738 [Pseudogymnoascus destructans]|uniref:Uncharacterized protein n=2 Tax=Pseudogymnoascus destructans TaxID=655981 RepID=L8G7X9_PSED2|nr:uncharacterized protein VC83_02738 [Pseudogymnoascus destructans]ELR09345.1 hypothetical protein GMDG_03911 [Pseudogymnoascus destructans 20631-21]OAF60859.1 hypothetical protein VC83_02738 [Pseudogymnoascus destructans]
MSSSLSFYGGWAGIAVVGAGYWYLQNRKPAVKQTKAAPTKPATKQTEARKDDKTKKQRSEGAQSSGDQASEKSTTKTARKAVRIDAKPAVQNITPQPSTTSNDDDDDEIDNREFARQLSNAKAGTVIGSKPQAGARQKSVKQSRAQAAASNSFDDNTASATSSNAGADADDDLSPALNARSSNNLGGVGDMLEPASQGPSVLRITSPVNPQPKKDKKAAKAPEPVETKKQRQNRKKREAEKLALAASETDRKVLLESQRRTAREAEGRAAKDGSLYTNSAAAASIWKADQAVAETKPANGQVELLDTYEPATKPAATKPKAKGSDDYATLPSEEEQLRLIEEDSAWNTVTKPKKGKKKAVETVKPVEAPTPAPNVPETKLPKQRTVELTWVDNNEQGVAKYDLADDDWEVA